jgi:threonine dehydrogenase-like Zn-dependent dehydrogenase
MKALMVEPRTASSLRMEDIAEPSPQQGDVLVRAVALGICGTDRDIIGGEYGSPPPGHRGLVLGHESLGIVEDAPAHGGVRPGDLVVAFVRMPDPLPCACCAAGEWDRCRNGGFTEHGVKALDGFGRDRYRLAHDRVIKVDASLGIRGVLVEPASVVAKAWEDIDRIGRRACWTPRRVLVTGAGPVGLLAALLGRQRELDVHVFDRATAGNKPDLVRALGAVYHSGELDGVTSDFDIVIECTAATAVIAGVVSRSAPDAVICLLGVTSAGNTMNVDMGDLNGRMVLGNRVMFGSVNANRRHYEAAHRALVAADGAWLDRLITRRVPFTDWPAAFAKEPEDVKTILTFGTTDLATA